MMKRMLFFTLSQLWFQLRNEWSTKEGKSTKVHNNISYQAGTMSLSRLSKRLLVLGKMS